MNRIFSLFFVSLLLLSLVPVGYSSPFGWYGEWENRITLYVASSDLGESFFEYPFLLNVSSSSGKNNYDLTPVFDEIADDTDCLLVTDETQTPLYIEVDYWNSTRESGAIWINAPFLSSSVDNFFYLYFDSLKDGSAYQNASKVWENYVGVWHMNNETLVVPDSLNVLNASIHSTIPERQPSTINGLIGDALLFDGYDDYIWVVGSDTNWENETELTISYLIYPIANGNDINKAGFKSSTFNLQQYTTDDKIRFEVYLNSSYRSAISAVDTAPINSWLLVTGTYDQDRLRVYVNGEYLTSSQYVNGVFADSDINLYFGGAGYMSAPLNGTQDETRLSNVALSADWIALDYLTLTDNLITIFGAQQYVSDNMWAFVVLFIVVLAAQIVLILKGGWLLNFFFGIVTVMASVYYYDLVPSLPLGYLMPLILTFFSIGLFVSALLSRSEV